MLFRLARDTSGETTLLAAVQRTARVDGSTPTFSFENSIVKRRLGLQSQVDASRRDSDDALQNVNMWYAEYSTSRYVEFGIWPEPDPVSDADRLDPQLKSLK